MGVCWNVFCSAIRFFLYRLLVRSLYTTKCDVQSFTHHKWVVPKWKRQNNADGSSEDGKSYITSCTSETMLKTMKKKQQRSKKSHNSTWMDTKKRKQKQNSETTYTPVRTIRNIFLDCTTLFMPMDSKSETRHSSHSECVYWNVLVTCNGIRVQWKMYTFRLSSDYSDLIVGLGKSRIQKSTVYSLVWKRNWMSRQEMKKIADGKKWQKLIKTIAINLKNFQWFLCHFSWILPTFSQS